MDTLYRADAILNYAGNVPAFLKDVKFHGIVGTKLSALKKEISELFNSRTLDELVRNSHLASKHMREVGLFNNCIPVIDTSAVDGESYTVNFFVREPNNYTAGAKGNVTLSGDAEFVLQGMKKSIFGAGEMGVISYTKKYKGGHSFEITGEKPFLGWQKYLNVGASLSRRFDTLRWNKSNVVQNEFYVERTGRFFDNRLRHGLRLIMSWRAFEPKTDAPFPVREHAGHTSKISLENVTAYDTRDRPLLPTRGILARLSTEYAGLVGDAAFLKNQLDLHMATTLPYGLMFSGSARMSVVDGLAGPVGRNIHLLDRIYMGGPQDVRGFELNSIGTRVDGAALGGAFGLSGALHLYRTLFPVDLLYAHLFVSAGGLASVRSRQRLADVLDQSRATVGVGLTFVYNNLMRMELNYVQPIRGMYGDAFSPGFQFGIGVNFL